MTTPHDVRYGERWIRVAARALSLGAFVWFLATDHWPLTTVSAAQLPSLFRDVVVADSPLGVRVVSVEESSQAFLADLRPEDIIVRVHEAEVDSIDEFAILSQALKGRAVSTTVLIFRNGIPRELVLHLYSYPILREWGIEFMPDHDIRFAEPQVGFAYWVRMGRAFEEAGRPAEALNAYLNGLHNLPTDSAIALKASELFSQVSRRHLAQGELADGITHLHKALVMLDRLFEYDLTTEQLEAVRVQLHQTRESLRAARTTPR